MNAHVGADGIEFRPDDTTVHGLHFPKTTLNMGKLPMPRPGDVARRGVIGTFASSSSSGSRNMVRAKGLSALKDSRTHEIGQIALGRSVLLAWEVGSDGQRSTRRNYGRYSVESH